MQMDTKEPRDKVEKNILDRIVWSHERSRARLVVLVAIAIIALAAWGIVESVMRHNEHREWLDFMAGYDIEVIDCVQDGQGVNIIGDGNGVIHNGAEVESSENDAQVQRGNPREGDP